MTSPGPPGPPAAARERWACRARTTLAGHASGVHALAWGQLGGRPVLASGGWDDGYGTVRLWDPGSGQELARLTGHTGAVRALAWGQLGGRPVLASGGPSDGTVRLWDPESGQELARLTCSIFRGDFGGGGVAGLAWGQLGGRPVLASSGDDATVRLWDPGSGQELARLTGHIGTVHALAWGQLGVRALLRRLGRAAGLPEVLVANLSPHLCGSPSTPTDRTGIRLDARFGRQQAHADGGQGLIGHHRLTC